MKRILGTVVAATTAIAALAATAGCTGSDGSGSDGSGEGKPGAVARVTYLTSFGTFGRDAYAYVAREKGYFTEAGFDVEIKPGQGSADNIKLIVGGQAQYTPIDLTGALLSMGTGQGADFVAVAAIQQRTMAAIMSVEGRAIDTPEALEGKKIADTPGSVVRNLFPTYARLANVDEKKVTWLNGQAQTLMALLASGAVDGIGQFAVGAPTVRVVTNKNPVVLRYSDYIPDLFGNVLVTSAKLAKDDPEQVKRFTAALLKGLQYSLDNPREAGQILAKYVVTTTADSAAAELELMAAYVKPTPDTKLGAIDSERVARSIATLRSAGAIPAGLTPSSVIDFDLVPRS